MPAIGIRNNNPGNMRPGKLKFQGEIGSENNLIIFKDMPHGIRAWLINYHTQVVKYGIKTIRQWVTKYAPPNENDTAQYIQLITKKTGFEPDEPLPLDQDYVAAVFKAHNQIENGSDSHIVTDQDISKGFELFNQSKPGFFLSAIAKNRPAAIAAAVLLICGITYLALKSNDKPS